MGVAPDFGPLLRVLAVFDELGIRYVIGGSLASSTHGFARPTQDFDVAAAIDPALADRIASALGPDFYADPESIREGIQLGCSFNFIPMDGMEKIDIFPVREDGRAGAEFKRARQMALYPGAPLVSILSPEDTVLRKLEWYRMGGCTSERQWTDILGVVKVQGASLDRSYLEEVAAQIGVADLLRKIFEEAGDL